MWVWCVKVFAALAILGGGKGDLPPPEASYKVLMLLPVSSGSHRNVFMPLAEALGDRGHKVVMLTNPPRASTHPNITELTHGLSYWSSDAMNLFDMRHSGMLMKNEEVLPKYARDLYKLDVVKQLYKRRTDFDIIIINQFQNQMMFPFVDDVPFITLVPTIVDFLYSAILGNVLNPAYVPERLSPFCRIKSFWDRLLNTYYMLKKPIYWRHWAVMPAIQKEISVHFPDLPPLVDLERNQSLSLINSHFLLSTVVPLLPSQVEVGAIHCRPAKTLPKEIASWLSGGGSSGVIYFSLGSLARSNTMPARYRNILLAAFRTLPQRVLWKYEEGLQDVPHNVMISKWLPQQDILGNKNVKLFISHGGQMSTQESLYHATPLLVLPILHDQHRNAEYVTMNGFGDMLMWEDLTPQVIISTVNNLINNASYQDNVDRMSRLLRDQLTTPVDRAVFWTEYVIRHRGAPQLRSPAAQLSWVQFLMLDVLVILAVGLFMASYVLYRIMRFIAVKFFGGTENKKKTE